MNLILITLVLVKLTQKEGLPLSEAWSTIEVARIDVEHSLLLLLLTLLGLAETVTAISAMLSTSPHWHRSCVASSGSVVCRVRPRLTVAFEEIHRDGL